MIVDILLSIGIFLVLCFVIYAIRREIRQPTKPDRAATLEGAGGGSHSTRKEK